VIDVTAARQTEDELRRSEEKYRELMQLSPDAIYIVDEAGILASTNHAGLAMLQCTPEEASGFDMANTHLSEDRVAYGERLQQLKAGKRFQLERSFLRRDGTVLPVEVTVSPIRNGLSQAVIRDIGDRKRTREALERSEYYLAEAERLSHSASWAYDIMTQRFIYWSAEYFRLVRLDPSQPPPSLEELGRGYEPEDWATLMEKWTRSIKEKKDYSVETRRTYPDGSIQHCRIVGHPIANAAGEIVEMMGTTMDVTEQVEARAALDQAFERIKRSEDQLQLIVDTIPALVWCAAPDGKLEYVNRRVLNYIGVPETQLVHLGWTDFLHPDDVEPTMRAWLHAISTGTRHEVEYRLRGSDGAFRWFHVLGQPLRNSDGQIIRWYGLLTDIEDKRNAAEILQRTQARLSQAMQVATVGEFAASVAHEVNQPLAAAVTNAHACLQWLTACPPNLAEANLAAARIIRNGNDAADVVRRIRALFKQAEPAMIPLHLNEVIAEVLRLLKDEILRQSVAVETDLTEELPQVLADRLQLQQVIFNLIQNGIEAMHALTDCPKKLVIRAKRQRADTALIEIRDFGCGLSDYEKAFEAFYTTKESGMGMGLAICRSIIDAHYGRLWAAPTEGPGATLCFTLPLIEDLESYAPTLRKVNVNRSS
jgi:PAS domain S-box-containing protein